MLDLQQAAQIQVNCLVIVSHSESVSYDYGQQFVCEFDTVTVSVINNSLIFFQIKCVLSVIVCKV